MIYRFQGLVCNVMNWTLYLEWKYRGFNCQNQAVCSTLWKWFFQNQTWYVHYCWKSFFSKVRILYCYYIGTLAEINQILLKIYSIHILLTFMHLVTLYQKTELQTNPSQQTRTQLIIASDISNKQVWFIASLPGSAHKSGTFKSNSFCNVQNPRKYSYVYFHYYCLTNCGRKLIF